MKKGDRVARVCLGSGDGEIGERGIVDRVFENAGEVYGFDVIWDKRPKSAQYVAPSRVEARERI